MTDKFHLGAAVLGVAMIAMGEEVGLEMVIRSLEHLLQYGELSIRRAVPLALGLLCISNPKVNPPCKIDLAIGTIDLGGLYNVGTAKFALPIFQVCIV